MKLYRDLDLTQKSAWHLARRIRETWDRGVGPAGKTAGVGAEDHETNRFAAKAVESTDKETLQGLGRPASHCLLGRCELLRDTAVRARDRESLGE